MMTPQEARLTEEVAALRAENKLLREKVDLLIRRIFGRSSEQLDDGQLMLLLQGGDDGAKKDPASSASPGVLEAEIEKRGRAKKVAWQIVHCGRSGEWRGVQPGPQLQL